ncbi:MAG TPA: division plane positioning ATPase MipZ [Alphaproteobacteria bacterium]|nr:division plane positioning ATPase MipZ [Alphaproteobacteria bacterium]
MPGFANPLNFAPQALEPPPLPEARARVVVLGNEKGGSGKSTAAMHLIVGLLRQGLKVGSIDVDARQATLSRYVDNRHARVAAKGVDLPTPEHRTVKRSELSGTAAQDDERARFIEAFAPLSAANDVVVIDTPGSDNFLSRFAHSFADTLITPMNDSFIDLDLLAKVDADTLKIERVSLYSEMVWEQRKRRAMRDGGSIDWIVMRNRLASHDARNKRNVADVLQRLSKRIGFRLAPGFGDRVIFRELFLGGLTLLDLKQVGGPSLTMSQLAARQEVRDLIAAVGITAVLQAPPASHATATGID